jgi:dihydrofolate synthase / folylpolyglutamate synthase
MAPADPLEFLSSLERLGMKFGLGNIDALCAALGHPERAFSSILIAGTNGKGSVTVMVETALRSAGHHAARYTSPHLLRLEERFVIDGREVTPGVLRDAIATVQAAVESLIDRGVLEGPPTFFECATAAAFELFRSARVEIAVLEVGLGGRLDATNIVTPIATAITSIDFDHQAQLGDTIEAIASEKAGIIKPRVPVICGPLPPGAANVIREIARTRAAPLIDALDQVRVVSGETEGSVSVRSPMRALESVTLALRGRHQLDNAAVAVALLDELAHQGVRVTDEAVRRGLTDAEWPGRLERFSRGGVDILLDAAHNPAGARALASHLGEIGWNRVTLVFGAMRDKDVQSLLQTLMPFCESIICTTAPTPRALSASEIATLAVRMGARVETIDDPETAIARAIAIGRPVVAAGSIFLIGPLRDILR